MKKITKLLTAVCAGAFALAACTPKAGAPLFGTVSDSETIIQGDKSLELDYRLEYISSYRNADVAQKIQRSMVSDFFGEDYLRATPEESAKAFHDSTVADYYEATSGEYQWNVFYKIRSNNDVLNDRIIAYTIERSEYTGGAHGMETVIYSNYDLRTGDKLTLGDVFTPEGRAALAGVIRQAILKEYGKTTWEQLSELNCFVSMEEVLPTENFLLSEEHITFMYNPYEIACYAQGRTKVRLRLDELTGFRKEALVK